MSDEDDSYARLLFPTRFFPDGLVFLRKENRFVIPYIGKTLAMAGDVVFRHDNRDYKGFKGSIDANGMDLAFRRLGSDGHVFLGRISGTESCLLHVYGKKIVDGILIMEMAEAVKFRCDNDNFAH
jgi:hypothetical protein